MSSETTSVGQGVARPTGSQVNDYLALLKPRVMSLVVFTGFAALAIGTEARRGEIAALRWSDIDLEAATVRIERSL